MSEDVEAGGDAGRAASSGSDAEVVPKPGRPSRAPTYQGAWAPIVAAAQRRVRFLVEAFLVTLLVGSIAIHDFPEATMDYGPVVVAAMAIIASLVVSHWTLEEQRLSVEDDRRFAGKREAYGLLLEEFPTGTLTHRATALLKVFGSPAVVAAVSRWHGWISGARIPDAKDTPEARHYRRVAQWVVQHDLADGEEVAMSEWERLRNTPIPDEADVVKQVSALDELGYLERWPEK